MQGEKTYVSRYLRDNASPYTKPITVLSKQKGEFIPSEVERKGRVLRLQLSFKAVVVSDDFFVLYF